MPNTMLLHKLISFVEVMIFNLVCCKKVTYALTNMINTVIT